MSFKIKTLKVAEHDVEVKCERIDEDQPCHRVRFTAELEGTKYDHTMTIGPIDGPILPTSVEQLQKDVDAARLHTATHAHFQHSVKQLIPQID